MNAVGEMLGDVDGLRDTDGAVGATLGVNVGDTDGEEDGDEDGEDVFEKRKNAEEQDAVSVVENDAQSNLVLPQ